VADDRDVNELRIRCMQHIPAEPDAYERGRSGRRQQNIRLGEKRVELHAIARHFEIENDVFDIAV